MIKLITPMGMLVTVALLAIYAVYACWTAYFFWPRFMEESVLYALLGVVSIVACAGTALLRPWSRYLVYGLTVFFVGGWFYSVYHGYSVEYFRFFFESPAAVAKALAPGLALVVLSCAASWMTYSHFRMARGVTKT